MNRIIENQLIRGFSDFNSGKTFSDLEFRKCSFVSVDISTTLNVRRRSTIRNVKIFDCEQRGCTLGPAIVEDVSIHNIKTHTLFQTWGAVFKHTTISGNIGRLMVSPLIAPGLAKPKQQLQFDLANAQYYSTVDWALDIRDAQFIEVDIRNLPTRLILRDPETQFIITRQKALEGNWRQVDLADEYWKIIINLFLDFGYEDNLLIAPRLNRRFRALLDDLLRLRDAGIVE